MISYERKQIAKGLPASPGAATGTVVFDADEAEQLGNDGKKVILVRSETTPDDIHGIVAAQGSCNKPWRNDKPCSSSSKRNGESMYLWL